MSCGPKTVDLISAGPEFGGLISSGPNSSSLKDPMSGGPKSGGPQGPSTVYGATCNGNHYLVCLNCTHLRSSS